MTAYWPGTLVRCLGLGLLILGALSYPAGGAFAGAQLGIVINEINYAARSTATGPLKYEYVELYAKVTTNITGWWLLNLDAGNARAPLFQFPSLTLTTGTYLVIVSGNATGDLQEDTDLSDGSGLLIAPLWMGTNGLANSGDAVDLSDAPQTTIQDFVYYDEANTGDPTVDDTAVAEGIWKDGAAIDVLSSGTVGRAIALRDDGESPNEVNPAPDAEDQDWMQYSAAEGGTPGASNSGTVGVFSGEVQTAGFRDIRPSPVTSGEASFRFTLPAPGRVRFEIRDVSGRSVSSVPAAFFGAGPAEVVWNPTRSDAGRLLPAGVYVVQMILDGHLAGTRKLTVLH